MKTDTQTKQSPTWHIAISALQMLWAITFMFEALRLNRQDNFSAFFYASVLAITFGVLANLRMYRALKAIRASRQLP